MITLKENTLYYWARQSVFIFTVLATLIFQAEPAALLEKAPRKIAFSSYRDGNWNLWSVKEDGTDLIQLTNTAEEEHSPALSPADGMILYHTNRQEIRLKKTDQSPPIKITQGGKDCKPVFFPDGKKIAFLRYSFLGEIEESDIFVYEINEEKENGRMISPQKLFHHEGIINSLAISPDGSKIAYSLFQRSGQPGTEEIWIRDSDGRNARQVTRMGSISYQPSWSPDSSRLIFSSNKSGNYDLWIIAEDGSSLKQLTDHHSYDGHPSWSLDGNRIVFQSTRGGGMGLWILFLESNRKIYLSSGGEDDREPSWFQTNIKPES